MTERDERRFWSKVALPNEQGCMLWLASQDKDGYGRFRLDRGYVLAHRFAHELLIGPIPKGLQVDHVKADGCTNRHCVAPAHLEAVTGPENARRSNVGIKKRSQTACIHGHPYDDRNTYVRPNGTRQCRACRRLAAKARRAA